MAKKEESLNELKGKYGSEVCRNNKLKREVKALEKDRLDAVIALKRLLYDVDWFHSEAGASCFCCGAGGDQPHKATCHRELARAIVRGAGY
jgi:hypothetical protein